MLGLSGMVQAHQLVACVLGSSSGAKLGFERLYSMEIGQLLCL